MTTPVQRLEPYTRASGLIEREPAERPGVKFPDETQSTSEAPSTEALSAAETVHAVSRR